MEKFVVFVSILLFVVSCSSSVDGTVKEDDINKLIEEAKKKSAVQHKESEDLSLKLSDIMKQKSAYVYSSVGKRDPFKSYFGNLRVFAREKKIISELQKYDIGDLRLTAIIWGITDPRAIVVAPDGKSFIVKKGSFIGKNWGKISKILPDKVEIVETYKDPLGRKVLTKLYLELPVKKLRLKE